MINLLPPASKESIGYARRNTRLLKWCFAAVLFSVGVVALVIYGQFYIGQSIDSYAQDVEAAREQLRVQKLEDTQKRVEEISSQFKLVVQVLSREVLFSELLKQIGAVMPPNTVLTNLDISKIQGGLDLQASAIDYNAATQVQINLQDPANKIFEKVDINSIDCKADTSRVYPCLVNLRALFGKNNQFLFIGPQKTEGSGQ